MFHVRLWDYSNEWMNYEGLICPKFSLFWGLICALYYFLLYPVFRSFAIRVVDQKPGVYVAEGKTAAWKQVKILYDNGESYVVELDKSSIDNLWPGDEIIVGGRNLYDGKVVR